jgi:hypothetical protein
MRYSKLRMILKKLNIEAYVVDVNDERFYLNSNVSIKSVEYLSTNCILVSIEKNII